jgi:predicted DNA-binding transcriptional regulator AlpA
MKYTFTLKYQLSKHDCNHDELVERLGAAGCDDALLGLGLPGRIALEFVRESHSAESALASAVKDVKQAIPSARLFEAVPDFVGLTDVADMVGVTRQNMRKLMINNMLSFPAPVHEGKATIWHLAEVLAWLKTKGNYKFDQCIFDVSVMTMQINAAKRAIVQNSR